MHSGTLTFTFLRAGESRSALLLQQPRPHSCHAPECSFLREESFLTVFGCYNTVKPFTSTFPETHVPVPLLSNVQARLAPDFTFTREMSLYTSKLK